MVNARRLGRLGMLAVGLGMGAAVAATPGIASADTADLFGFDFNDIAISFNGVSLFQEGTATATTTTGAFGFAFADGTNANASATGGFGDYANAIGTNALATSGGSSSAYLDSASAFGAGANASATGGFGDSASATAGALAQAGDPGAGTTGNNFDVASAEGIGSLAQAGNTSDASYPDTIGSSFDHANAFSGYNTLAADGASAGAGANGSGDSASAVGQQVFAQSGLSLIATPANYDSADAWGNLFTPTPDQAIAAIGNGDTSFVIDPFGTVGSSALSGGVPTFTGGVLGENFGNFDLAGVFGDALHAGASGGNYLVDILPTVAGLDAALSTFLTDLGSLF